jgi:hypothetical protein
MTTFDPWETTSGLFTNYVGTVKEAWFAISERGSLEAHLKFATDSPDYPEWEERYGCGADWQCLDGGETAENSKGPNKGFNKSSGYGRFLTALQELGAADSLKAAGRTDPRKASMWVGVKMKMGPTGGKFKDSEGNMVEWNKNIPVAYLGVDQRFSGAQPASAPTTTSTTTPLVAPSPAPSVPAQPVAGNGDVGGLTDEQKATITALAKQHTFNDWLDAVLEVPGVAQNQAAVAYLGSETVYEQLRVS